MMFSCAMEPHNTYQPAVMRVNQQPTDRTETKHTEICKAGWQAVRQFLPNWRNHVLESSTTISCTGGNKSVSLLCLPYQPMAWMTCSSCYLNSAASFHLYI